MHSKTLFSLCRSRVHQRDLGPRNASGFIYWTLEGFFCWKFLARKSPELVTHKNYVNFLLLSVVFCSLSSVCKLGLVARIARPALLAFWHRAHWHPRPNRSQSPNRKHFSSLDLEKYADFLHRPTSQDFRGNFCGTFPVNFEQPKGYLHRDARKLYCMTSDLGVCGSIAHRSDIARFGPRRNWVHCKLRKNFSQVRLFSRAFF